MNKPLRPTDPRYLAQRREIIRRHHPDRGGNQEELISELDALDRKWQLRSQLEQLPVPGFLRGLGDDEATRKAARVAVRRLAKFRSATNRTIDRMSGFLETLADEVEQGYNEDPGSGRPKR